MDWQQISSLVVVALATLLLVRHWIQRRSRPGGCITCSACSMEHNEPLSQDLHIPPRLGGKSQGASSSA